MSSEHPQKRKIQVNIPAVAGGSDATTVLCIAPFAGVLSMAVLYAVSAITGANTNTRKLEVINKKQDGAGTTLMASKQFNSGTNAVAFDNTTITNSGTAADLVVAQGDVIVLVSTHVSTGIADPGGMVELTLTKDAA